MDRSRTLSSSLGRLLVVLLAVSWVGLSTGCDSGTQEPDAPGSEGSSAEAEPGGAAEPAGSAAVPETPRDGSIDPDRFPRDLPEGISAEIPENFPSNIPIYPGSEPAQGRGAEVEGSPLAGVQLLSNDSPADIFAFYDRELKANGWSIDESSNESMAASITASNSQGCKTSLFIAPSPRGGSDIFIVTEC